MLLKLCKLFRTFTWNCFALYKCILHVCDFCILWIGFETFGLDVLHDEILEVALTDDSSNTQFATTVRPIHVPDGPGVHGIEKDELLASPRFHEVFPRMLLFLNSIVESSLGLSDSSDDDTSDNVGRLPMLRDSSPRVLLVANNAIKV